MAVRKKKSSSVKRENSQNLPGNDSGPDKQKPKKEKKVIKQTAAKVVDHPVVITLDSVITLGEVANLREKLLEHIEAKQIEIDASKVEHIDTGGIQLLLSIANTFKKKGVKITWSGWSAPCLNTAQLLGLTKVLEMRE